MDKYDEIKCIGRGSYGTAHLVTLRGTNEKYVVKKIPTQLLTEKEKAQSFYEVELLAKLKHPNVVEYRENFVQDNVIHIVMAYCDGGDLAEKIRERVNLLEKIPSDDADARQRAYFDIGQILDWFVQMAMAIKYLHQQRILHRDLKTSNIFLTTENVIKLGDFGIAKTLDSTLDQAKTVVGTPYYMSPEVCENKPYSYSSDVWSLGCVLYEMCALKHAFDAPNIISLIFTIVRKECAPLPEHFDSEISDLLKRLLDKAPEKRPSMDQIFTMPYIRNHMQGLVASGGSLRVNTMARRPLGGAPKRRVHAKNMGQRRSSIESIKRKVRPNTASGAPPQPPPATQWIPITPLDVDDDYQQLEKEDTLELLDASILEESQLDLRVPERSRTPEPLVYFANENKPSGPPPAPVYSKAPQRQQPSRAHTEQVTAWTSEPSLGSEFDYEEEDGEYGGGQDGVEEEDVDSRFQAEAEELMNPNFENEYSEECMDSLQFYYRSKLSKAKSKRENSSTARFQAARQVTDRRSDLPVSAFRPTGMRSASFQVDHDDDEGRDDGDEGRQLHAVITKRLFPLSVSGDYDDPTQSPSIAAYEQWGRHAAHDDATLLQLEDVSYDATGDNIEMRESGVSLSDSGILRALEEEADSSGDDDDESASGDDYTSLSEYEAEENFYSDDSDFYEENDTQYSDDFEDGDAEVIEYANDEFSPDDSFDSDTVAPPAHLSVVVPSASSGAEAAGSRPAQSLSPTGKKQQKPPTEVQWVMRNVAQSLLQASHDDLTVA